MLDYFHPLENLDSLYHGYRRSFEVAGHNLLLICCGEQYFLIENRCPHMDWPLDSGVIGDQTITCPKHKIQFNLASGTACAPGRLEPLTRYDVLINAGQAGLDLRQLA